MKAATEVCKLHREDGYDWIEIHGPDSPPLNDLMRKRTPILSEWGIRQGVRVAKSGGRRLKRSAAPPWSARWEILLSGPAITPLSPFLAPFGELLPVDLEGETARLFHCLTDIDVVDLEKSQPDYSSVCPGKIMAFNHISFRPGTIPDICAFRPPAPQPTYVYYTAGLARAIVDTVDTSGIYFEIVWTEADGHVRGERIG